MRKKLQKKNRQISKSKNFPYQIFLKKSKEIVAGMSKRMIGKFTRELTKKYPYDGTHKRLRLRITKARRNSWRNSTAFTEQASKEI